MNETKERIHALAGTAGAVVDSAAAVAERQAEQARKSIASVVERGKDLSECACQRTRRKSCAIDGLMHDHLYQTVMLGMGLGAVIGFLAARRN